jgi:hypothetical protein
MTTVSHRRGMVIRKGSGAALKVCLTPASPPTMNDIEAQIAEYRAKKRREKKREYERRYRETHREHVREYMRAYMRKYMKEHRKKDKQ